MGTIALAHGRLRRREADDRKHVVGLCLNDQQARGDVDLLLRKQASLRRIKDSEVKRLADIFRGHIVDVTESTYVIELTASGAKLDSFIQAIDAGLILETVRTGVCGIGRGERILKV